MSSERSSGLAVGALVSAVAFAPLGIVLGLIARSRARRNGEPGEGIATAAVVVGAVVTVGMLLLAT